LQLITQLTPTFERISSHAFHRDVNSHNILVDGGDVLVPSYGLVDFGLAVDFAKWRGPGVSPTSWHLVDIGGDCRYWPMAAWLQFECGYQELTKYPALTIEYQTHLDLHALGITALQVWACMIAAALPEKKKSNEVSARNPGEPEQIPEEVIELHAAWEQYWQDATRFWERLLDCFRNNGDQNSLKGWCITEGVHNIIGQDLANVRTALRKVCNVCGPSPGGGTAGGSSMLVGQRPLFATLLELVSAGGVAGWVEGQKRKPSWQAVRALLDESSPGYRGTSPSSPLPPVAATSHPVATSNQQGLSRPASVLNPKPVPYTSISLAQAQAATAGGVAASFNRTVQSQPTGIAAYTAAAVHPGKRYEQQPLQSNGRQTSYGIPSKTVPAAGYDALVPKAAAYVPSRANGRT
jgi:hypothetical protein